MSDDEGLGPRRTASLWQTPDEAGDHSLIILRALDTGPRARDDQEAAGDPLERALLRAGFRSHAESLLLARMGGAEAPNASNGARPSAPGGTTHAIGAPADEAMDEARAIFGAVDPGTEREVRGGLDTMVTQIRESGRRRAEAIRHERALGALDAEIDDLVAQVRRAPDLLAGYATLLDRAVGRFEVGLEPGVVDTLRINARRELVEAQIVGLANRGRLAEARRALTDSGLPDERTAIVERTIVSAARDAESREIEDRTQVMVRMLLRLAEGDDPATVLSRAREAGVSADGISMLNTAWEEVETRLQEKRRLGALALRALDNGEQLDPDDAEHRAAADFLWDESLHPALLSLPLERRAVVAADFAIRIGLLPEGARRRLTRALASGEAEQVADAAQTVAALARDPGFRSHFSGRQLAYAGFVADGLEIGLAPATALAEARAAVALDPSIDTPPLASEEPVPHVTFLRPPQQPETSDYTPLPMPRPSSLGSRRPWPGRPPTVPKAKTEVAELTKPWADWWRLVRGLSGIGINESFAYMQIFAFEGGLDDDGLHTRAGIQQDTLDDLIAQGRLPSLLPGQAVTKLDLDQLAPVYRAYFSDIMRHVEGGAMAMDDASSMQAVAAFADTLFRFGRSAGARLIQEAINHVLETPVGLDGGIGPATWQGFLDATATPAKARLFLDALGDLRDAEIGPQGASGDRDRNDYFRFVRPAIVEAPPPIPPTKPLSP